MPIADLSQYEARQFQVQINTPEYIQRYLHENYPQIKVQSVVPYSFTVGSSNNAEGLPTTYHVKNSLFFGFLNLSVNPNDGPLSIEKIEIRYRSYFNIAPFVKRVTRYVEAENLINENSQSIELFDELTLSLASAKYDTYYTFIGFKIDYI